MSDARLRLDNKVFSGTLRYARRSVSYERRPVHAATIQDIIAVQQTQKNVAPRSVKTQQGQRVFMDMKDSARLSHQATHVKAHHVQSTATVQPRPRAVHGRKRVGFRVVTWRQAIIYASAVLVFGVGLYAGLSGIYANKKVATQVKALQNQGAVQGATTGDDTAPPSTEKPSPAAVRNHAVSPLNPRYIDIPRLNIHARVLSMDVTRKNELKSPYNIYDAGWYNASSRPGENGAMLVDGHSGIGKTHGIFHNLMQLQPGDDISVKRGDGQVFTYKVVRSEVVDVDNINMAKLLVSENTAKPGLNLITCAGDEIPGTFTLRQRAIVYAVMQ